MLHWLASLLVRIPGALPMRVTRLVNRSGNCSESRWRSHEIAPCLGMMLPSTTGLYRVECEIANSFLSGAAGIQTVIERQTDRPGYMTVLLEDGELVAANDYDHRPGTRDLRDFVLSPVVEPISGRPRKPMTIRVPTKADVTALAKSCGTYGVTVARSRGKWWVAISCSTSRVRRGRFLSEPCA